MKKKSILALFLALFLMISAFPLAALAAPTETGRNTAATPTTISVPVSEGQEYSIDGGRTWQKSGTFTGLTPDTEYSITARYAETEDTMPSPASAALMVRTKAASASVAVPETPVLISKTDRQVEISTVDGLEYSIDGGTTWQTSGTFERLAPNTGYEIIARVRETETAMPSGNSPALSVTTKKTAAPAPAQPPVVSDRTDTTLTVETVEGQEYSIDGGNTWQTSGLFEDLDPNSEYEVVTRVAETEDSMPSEVSSATSVRTKNPAPEAPAAPQLESRTDTEIKVRAVEGQEYSITEGKSWQDSAAFSGLSVHSPYSVITRTMETEDTVASPMSAPLVTGTKGRPAKDAAITLPRVLSVSTSSIRVETAEGQEYALRQAEKDTLCRDWQIEDTFSGLKSRTKYEVLTRLMETEDMVAGEVCAETTLVTTQAPVYNTNKEETHSAFIHGYPDGTVRPESLVTREEAAQMLFHVMGIEESSEGDKSYSDVPASRWSYAPISALTANHILSGYTDGSFRPAAKMTRGEFAAMISRWKSGTGTEAVSFTDISGHWAEEEIHQAASMGWIAGYGDGTFRPNDPITRAEAISILNRASNRCLKDAEGAAPSVWPDNDPSAWYYLDVTEASTTHTAVISDSREVWKK